MVKKFEDMFRCFGRVHQRDCRRELPCMV